MTAWTSLVSRARGLSTHLLSDGALDDIGRCATLQDLLIRLRELKYADATSVDGIELACRRVAADRIAVMERWTLGDRTVLQPFTLAEDLRSIRGLIRGAVSGFAPEKRLNGLVPTSALPLRALTRLSTLADVSEIGALLTIWRHPLAPAASAGASDQHVDLWRIDIALIAAWAAASLRACRSSRRYVRESIDIANAVTARLLAEQRLDAPPAELFVPGGRAIRAHDLEVAHTTHDVTSLAARVGGVLRATLSVESSDPEGDVLRARIASEREHARRDPLDAAVVSLVFLRVRAEQRAIVGTAWASAA